MPKQKKTTQAKPVQPESTQEKSHQTQSVQTDVIQPFDQWEEEMVNDRARSMIGKFGYMDKEQDWWDIKQELLLAILEKQGSFPKSSDPKVVFKRIIDDQASWMIKKRKSAHEKVHAPQALSLSAPIDESFEGQKLTYEDILEEDQSPDRIEGQTRKGAEIKEAIESIFRSLTPLQKKVFLSLQRTGSVKDTSVELGVTIQAVYDIRRRMKKALKREVS